MKTFTPPSPTRFEKWWNSLTEQEKTDAAYPPNKPYYGYDTSEKDKMQSFYKAINEGKA